MRQLVAMFALLVWITCYAQCVGRLSGVEMGGDPCCAHDPQEQPGKETQKTCGVCDAFVAGGIEVSQPLLMLGTLLAVAVISLLFVAFSIPISRLLQDCSREISRLRSWRAAHGRIVSLWEILVRTALPVRGPSLTLA